MKAVLFLALLSTTLFGADIEGKNGGAVRVVPMDRTPEPDAVQVHIAFPKEDDVLDSNPVTVQIRLEGYPIGYDSGTFFPRAKEVRDAGKGQTVRILVDDKPYIQIDEAIDDTADSEEVDFDQTLSTRLPYSLKSGVHVLRIFPVRSFGECLKGDKVFEAVSFYMDKESGKKFDLSRPYLTYNEPQGEFNKKQPVLLDFFVSNTQLSKDGYRVRLTIDGSDKRILSQWTPYYIYGLSSGRHTIKLELLDPQGRVLAPLFNDTEKTILVR